MRRALRYQFTADTLDGRFQETTAAVEEWLRAKGELRSSNGSLAIAYPTGRTAQLETSQERAARGQFKRWILSENDGERNFATTTTVVETDAGLIFSCELDVGSRETVIAPIGFNAFCPNVVKNILGMKCWFIGETAVTNTFVRFEGADAGSALAGFLADRRRRVPVVVVSEYDGLPLHIDLPLKLALDLAGAAVVAWVDEDASWALTDSLGKDLSCYMGAIRLYWPPPLEVGRGFVWTALHLIDLGPTRRDAASELRALLRRQILPLTALTVVPDLTAHLIEVEARKERFEAQLLAAKQDGNVDDLFEQAASHNAELYAEIDRLKNENNDLRNRLDNEAVLQQWQQYTAPAPSAQHSQDVADQEPQTIKAAVEAARKLFADSLVFGDDVAQGVETVAAHAGPPPKVLKFLSGLAKMATALKDGPLGTPPVSWLNERGLTASGESETIRNSAAETQRRTWHDGRRKTAFEYHLKPNEATSPDQCVRIYFALDTEARKIRVGWVGKHP